MLLLAYTTCKTTRKGQAAYRRESHVRRTSTRDPPAAAGAVALGAPTSPAPATPGPFSPTAPLLPGTAHATLLERDRSSPESRTLCLLLCVWGTVLLTNYLKQSPAAGVRCGSSLYWGLTLLPVPVTVVYLLGMIRWTLREHELKRRLGFEFAAGDLQWSEAATAKYVLFMAVAGLSAGCLGIGGGTIQGPVLLEMGMLPQVCSPPAAALLHFWTDCGADGSWFWLLAGLRKTPTCRPLTSTGS